MPATAIPATERFFQPEVSKVIFVPTVAATTKIPTRAEINAGDDLSEEIESLSGWMVVSNTINTPDLGSRFTRQIGGRITAENSSITFYASKDGDDVRKVLPRGTTGFMFFADGGDVPTQPADNFPIEVTSVGKARGTGDTALLVTIGFAITDVPVEDFPIPANS